jgi:hypothetical protein
MRSSFMKGVPEKRSSQANHFFVSEMAAWLEVHGIVPPSTKINHNVQLASIIDSWMTDATQEHSQE